MPAPGGHDTLRVTGRMHHIGDVEKMARVTGLEPATSGVTGRHSNRLSYTRASDSEPWRPLVVALH